MTVARGLHGQLLDTLGRALTSGMYPTGTVVRLDELTAHYGVSRTVAREAVRVLEALRMVRSRPKIGTIVLPVEQWNLFDPQLIRWRLAGTDRRLVLGELAQLRAAVEPVAAGMAARFASAEQRAGMRRLTAAMSKHASMGDIAGFIAADVAFHRLMFVASGNGMFVHLADVTAEVLHGRVELRLLPPTLQNDALTWHVQAADAICRGAVAQAEEVVRRIVVEAAAEVDELLES